MGCHVWTFATKKDYEQRNHDTAPHDFMFRVYDYQEDVLTSYEQAEEFILSTLKKSTNNKPKVKSKFKNVALTHTGEMKGKIKLASIDTQADEFIDPALTLHRVKEFFQKYPQGIITFG